MKNVCFFNSLPFWGGGEKLHLEYAWAFKKRGFKVCIMAYQNGPLWQAAQKSETKVIPVEVGSLSFLNPLALTKTAKIFADLKIDTVIFSTSQDAKFAGIAAKKAGITRIVYLRGLAVAIKNSLINRYLFKNIVTHLVANSQATAQQATKYLKNAISTEKLGIVYHGIEIPPQKISRKLAEIEQTQKGIVLGNAGRLTKQKGQHYLLEVASTLKKMNVNFSLYIAGTGELKHDLEQEIKRQNLGAHVHLLGFVGDMPAFMNSLDIFLMSSSWEGFGYVLAEAMLQKKPIVGFDISSNPEIVLNNQTGFLVPYPDIQAFTQKTLSLINNPEMRQQMGKRGFESVCTNFEIESRVDGFINFIK